MDLSKLLTRAYVLASTFVTYVTALAAGILLASDRIAEAAPEGSETTVAWLVRAAAFLAEVVAIVRSVTPVPSSARGVLMPAGKQLVVDVVGPPLDHSPPS